MDDVAMIELRDLVLEIDRVRLIDIEHLEIERGAPTLLLGPNGAGKSLLLRLLHGLIEPTSGEIRLSGSLRQAMVFQKPVLLRRSVLANVEYAMRAAGLSVDGAMDLLADTGLAEKSNQSARTLSGGEQQLLAMIRAMATQPDILFLDEPTSSLDPASSRAIEWMIKTAADNGTKVIMVSHNPAQARRLAGEVLFCHNGRILEQAPSEQFFEGPASKDAALFIAGELIE